MDLYAPQRAASSRRSWAATLLFVCGTLALAILQLQQKRFAFANLLTDTVQVAPDLELKLPRNWKSTPFLNQNTIMYTITLDDHTNAELLVVTPPKGSIDNIKDASLWVYRTHIPQPDVSTLQFEMRGPCRLGDLPAESAITFLRITAEKGWVQVLVWGHSPDNEPIILAVTPDQTQNINQLKVLLEQIAANVRFL
ncbi:MAG: hypothetical protein HJJLKODD_02621 [Phycisphaerae bacterium]|nr:hypothetical protein [Phycisphaerae bacterium]